MKQSSGGMASSRVVIPATLVVVVALLVASCFGPTAAAAAGGGGRPSHTDDSTICLPSSSSGGAVGRPWECCDWVTQDPVFRPPRWRCNDVVDECSADCQQCEAASASGDGDGFVCRDWVVSLLEPPVCTPRPWDCCDVAACTRGYIPYCRCTDTVESCPSNCKECELVESSSDSNDPPRYRCLDVFHGYPGPKCTPFWVSKSN